MSTSSAVPPAQAATADPVSCSSCRACCCRLEVMLMAEDEVPAEMVESDRWGGEVMARLADGWCIALDRETMRCRIYELRPSVCRNFEVGADDCLAERKSLTAARFQSASRHPRELP